MGLAYASLYLLGLTVLAIVGVWFFFYKIPQGEKDSYLSELDQDLIKTKKSADVHKNRIFYFIIAFFVVSVYSFVLITWTDVTEYKEITKKAPEAFKGSEIEIEEIEIKDPEPPKPTVIKVPKVVPNTVVKKDTVKQEKLPDDDFGDLGDDDDDLDDEEEEETKGPAPIQDFVENEAEFGNGGIIGFQNFITAQIQPQLKTGYNLGFYVIPIEFVVEQDGRITNVKVPDDDEAEDPKMAQVIINAVKKSPRWTPGKIDGQFVRQRLVQPFEVEIK